MKIVTSITSFSLRLRKFTPKTLFAYVPQDLALSDSKYYAKTSEVWVTFPCGIAVEDRLRGIDFEDLQKLPDALLKSFNLDHLKKFLELLNDKIVGDKR